MATRVVLGFNGGLQVVCFLTISMRGHTPVMQLAVGGYVTPLVRGIGCQVTLEETRHALEEMPPSRFLEAAEAVHGARIDGQVEGHPRLNEGAGHLEGILRMHVVVAVP